MLTAFLNVSRSTVSSINLSAHFSPLLLTISFAFLASNNRSLSFNGFVDGDLDVEGPAIAFEPDSRVATFSLTGLE